MTKNTSILQFSDVHFGSEDRDAIAAVRDMALTLKPDISVICGDITQSGKKHEFEAAHHWIKSLPGPKLITPGNHDTPMFGLVHRAFDAFGRYNDAIAPLSEEYYADQNVMIVKMNTARGLQLKFDWSLGVVDMDELGKKIHHLRSAKPRTLKFIACHHPFLYPTSSPLRRKTENGQKAIQKLSDHDIDSVLSGHVHAPFFADREPGKSGILSIGSGTLSTRSRGVDASFNHINITNDDISVTPISWTGSEFIAGEQWQKNRSELEPS